MSQFYFHEISVDPFEFAKTIRLVSYMLKTAFYFFYTACVVHYVSRALLTHLRIHPGNKRGKIAWYTSAALRYIMFLSFHLRSPQQREAIAAGPYYVTYPVNFPMWEETGVPGGNPR